MSHHPFIFPSSTKLCSQHAAGNCADKFAWNGKTYGLKTLTIEITKNTEKNFLNSVNSVLSVVEIF
jgi:hypothetical protein